jgi:DNA-binding MarR family transcriptional regulator
MAELAEDDASDAWLSVSALARELGRDKGGVSRRISRLEAQGLLKPRVGKAGEKLINRAEFDRVAVETVDAIQEANGRRRAAASPVVEDDMGDASVGPRLATQQARKTMLAADIAQLQLDELRGLLVRVADIDAGAAIQGETLARRIDQMLPEWADDLAAVVAKDGTAGLRAALKGKARELRGALAEAFAALAATPAHEDGKGMVELEVETAA